MVVVSGVGSQASAMRWSNSHSMVRKSTDTHSGGLKQFHNDGTFGVAKIVAKSVLADAVKDSAINERYRVFDAVFLYEFTKEFSCWISASVLRKSCLEYNFRVYVDCCVQPRRCFFDEVDLFFH